MPRDTRRVDAALRRAEALLANGVSIRKAAEACGIGRTTIRRYLAKRQKLRRPLRRPPPLCYDVESDQMLETQRCPGCGAMVVMPCRQCSLTAESE